ncbi:MAG TPA: NADH-quinone oxidoreductase subunit M [Catalimonadaceae bacterium]|nr:NADH-quinone oxidoreductase subunit M [Catalimonadaceae bacterium]
MSHPLLSYIVFWPFLLAVLVLLIPSDLTRILKLVLIAGMLVMVGLCGYAFLGFDPALAQDQTWMGYQLVEKKDWISLNLQGFGSLSIDYLLGVDGMSISLIALTGLVLLVAAISSWSIEKQVKGYVLSFLLMAGSIAGCFVALDFFLFFIFFEFMLLPMFFLIGIWGGVKREFAAIKFFLYTLTGSVFILMTMIALYMSTIDPVETAINFGLMNPGEMLTTEVIFEVQQLLATGSIPAENIVHTFTIPYLTDESNLIPYSVLSFDSTSAFLGQPLRNWGFFLLLLGFLIKLPAAPFHTWLPDAHVEAPTAVSVVLAGLLLKVGAYGLLRIVLPVFPDLIVQYAYPLSVLGLFSLFYGGLNALGSTDLKRLVAYSSISHMGYVVIGIASLTAEGLSGAVFQCVSHGLISPFLFLLVGVIYDRTHNRNRDDFAGLVQPMPRYVAFAMVGFFASMGIPAFSGFIGEVLVVIGAFKSSGFNQFIPRWVALMTTAGILLSASYYLYTARKMFFGEFWSRDPQWKESLTDLNLREYLMLVPLLVAFVALGIFPQYLMEYLNPAVERLTDWVTGR